MIDGIIEKDKNLLVRAIALDPLTPSPDKAEKILNHFIEDSIIRKYLSTYNFDLSGSI
jgi:alpha-galactosidase/6-phospho-beta-glucosidase family protein